MLDLTFEEEGAELEFREELVLRSRPTELRLRLCGVLSLTLHCQQLARAGGGGGGSAAVALVGFLTGAFLLAFAWRQTGQSLRQRYWALVVGNCLQMAAGAHGLLSLVPSPAGGAAAPLPGLHAPAVLLPCLLAFTKTAPLPFRWQLPLLAALTAILLAHAPLHCASPLLQRGYALVHTTSRFLLPILVPGAIETLPQEGLRAALAARGAPSDPGAAALCCSCHVAALLLSAVVVAERLYCSERQLRASFRAERLRRTAAAVAVDELISPLPTAGTEGLCRR